MSQGWSVNATADTITFLEAPANAAAIVVKQFEAGAVGGTDAWALGAWNDSAGWPSEAEFFSDRLWFAGTPSDPQTIWASQIGDYTNMGKSTPIVDSDAMSFTINARQVNAIQDLIPLDKMVVLTTGGEWLLTGGQNDVVTPSTISMRPQSYLGSGALQSKVVGDTAVMVQKQGQHVFDIGYRFEQDGYRPRDISVYAEHLVNGHALLSLDWSPAPFRVIWFVRDDGILVGCSYLPEQETIGWHRHDTGGTAVGDYLDEIEDVVCMPGDLETEEYFIVKRTINGQTKRYIEQSAPCFVDDPRDWFFVDCGLTYDGRNTGATTLTLTATDWDETDELTLTASSGIFSGTSDVGDGFLLTRTIAETDPSTGVTADVDYTVRLRITGYSSGTVVSVQSIGTVPEELRETAITDWVFQRDTISGLDHLEGMTVAILADASVVSNGRSAPFYVVEDGEITLPYPAGVVQVGLPYRAQITTLDLNAPGGPGLRDATKLMNSVGLLLKGTRGIRAGIRLDYLDELPQREFEDWGEATSALTGYGRINISAQWGENNGRLHIVSDDPLPAEILAIIPKFAASDR